MKVQCSILESQLRALKESPMRALNGNQDAPPISKRFANARRILHGMRGLLAEPGVGFGALHPPPHPIPSSPLQLYQWLATLYATRVDQASVSGRGFTASYTGRCFYSGAGRAPQVSGYPYSYDGSGLTGTGTGFDSYAGWAGDSPPNLGLALAGARGGAVTAMDSYSADLAELGTFQLQFSDLIDHAPDYLAIRNELLAQDFNSNFAINGPSITYDDAPQSGETAGINPAAYSGAAIVSAAAGSEIIHNVACSSGWRFNGGNVQDLLVFRSQAKVSTAGPHYYWIGRWRESVGAASQDGYASPTSSGRPGILRQIDFVSDGFLDQNQTIGGGAADVVLPFPASNPFPINALSSSGVDDGPVISEFYFAMIGSDPAGIAARVGAGTKMGTTIV
jgi:hypothetical protein